MSVYRFDGLTLTVEPTHLEAKTGLNQLCAALASPASQGTAPYLGGAVLRVHGHGVPAPPAAAIKHRTDAFDVFEDDQYSVRQRWRLDRAGAH